MARRLAPALSSLVLAALLTALLAPVGVAAQEVGEDPPEERGPDEPTGEVGEEQREPDEQDAVRDAFEVSGERLPVPDDAFQGFVNPGLVLWPEGRRVYQFIGAQNYGLAAYDLDSLEEVDRADRVAKEGTRIYGHQRNSAADGLVPVDRSGGRLFLPYTDDSLTAGDLQCGTSNLDMPCLRGIYVVDGDTLHVQEDLPFLATGADGAIARPALLAMGYWERAGARGKLLLLVQSQYNPGQGGNLNVAGNRRSLQYALQLDPVDGAVDWVTRLDGCTSDEQSDGVTTVGARSVIFGTELEGRGPEIYLGCYGSGALGTVVRLTMPADQPEAGPTAQASFKGPIRTIEMLADPDAGRLLMRAAPSSGDSILVFDAQREAFIGALGIGASVYDGTATGLDPVSGRLYAMTTTSSDGDPEDSRFLAGSSRGEALPQMLPVPGLEDLVASHHPDDVSKAFPLAVDPAADGRPARVFVRPGDEKTAPDFYYVIEDHRPDDEVVGGRLARDVPFTDDVPEVEGATQATFTGAARGYGFRTLLLGGLWSVISQANARGSVGAQLNEKPGAPAGNLYNAGLSFVPDAAEQPIRDVLSDEDLAELGVPVGDACLVRDRELVFGISGALDVLPDLGPDGAAAQAAAAVTDPQTADDLASSARCAEGTVALLSDLLRTAGIREPAGLGGPDLSPGWDHASCVAPGDRTSDEQGSQITPTSTSYAATSCEPGRRTAATGRTRLVDVGPVSVGEASSTFEITRQPGVGLVVTMRSVARDIGIAGAVHIDSVEATAVSWATGRSQPEAAGDEEYNCAEGRTAGTCLKQVLRGVTAGDFTCDECPTSEEMADGLQQALGSGWVVTLGEPDPFLAQGSDNGALAGIVKSPDRRFADSALNGDTLPTLPTLEIVRLNDDDQGRGRQIYQFAGVESSTSFGILCLLEVIDGVCTQRPGALSIELLDLEGLPLAGGAFELYRDLGSEDSDEGAEPGTDPSPSTTPSPTTSPSDRASPSESEEPSESESGSPGPSPSEGGVDAGGDVTVDDGSLVDPLVDELVDGGTCTTGVDGLGDCRFEKLPPGDYIVRQAGAPDGYLAAPDFVVTVGSDQDLTATVTNVSAVGQVDISLVDGDGGPLEGGEFALSRPDADPTGTCTTDVDGTCSIAVALPHGPAELVLSQTAAPEGLAPAPDTPFTLAPGETFTFMFTNVPPAGGSIRIGLVDDLTGAPLAGGGFEVHADDGDGLVGDGDVLVTACTTGADGACLYDPPAVDAAAVGREGPLAASGGDLTVPLGAYVVRQTAAPAGYQPAEDLAFAFDAAGQVADITVRNGGGGGTTGQSSVGRSESFSPPPTVTGPTPMDVDVPAPNVAPTNAGMGGPTVHQVLQAPADLARLVLRDPLQALAFLAAWALFGAAATAIHRRTVLSAVIGP